MIANAIDKSNKVYLMNGENDSEMLINELYQTVIGRDDKFYDEVKINKRIRKEPKTEVLKSLENGIKINSIYSIRVRANLKPLKN